MWKIEEKKFRTRNSGMVGADDWSCGRSFVWISSARFAHLSQEEVRCINKYCIFLAWVFQFYSQVFHFYFQIFHFRVFLIFFFKPSTFIFKVFSFLSSFRIRVGWIDWFAALMNFCFARLHDLFKLLVDD